MKIQPLKNICEVLQNSSLAKIVERSNEMQRLNQQIQRLLPEAYRSLYRAVNLYDNSLVIEVQNATIRQGLLLQQPFLLRLIQAELPTVTALEIRVNPDFRP